MVKNASKVDRQTLILQGEADIVALPIGAKRLLDALASRDKSLRTFPGADHWFCHAFISRPSSGYSDEQRERLSWVVVEWLRIR